MINIMKNDKGVIDINNLNVNVNVLNPYSGKYNFVYNDQLYYMKACPFSEAFKEVFASEFADYYNIKHAKYDVAYFDNAYGVLSTAVYNDNEELIPLSVIAEELGIDEKSANTIEVMKKKILPKICKKTQKEELVNYIRMFIFDILMANDDRNAENTCFIKNGDQYRLAPLFDNGYIACNNAINNHTYSQGIYKDTFDNDLVAEFFLSKRYGYLLADELENLNNTDLYSIVDDINVKYPFEFDVEYELYILKRLERNLRILNEYKKDFYDESKMLRR